MHKRIYGIECEYEMHPSGEYMKQDLFDKISNAFFSLLPRMRDGKRITPPPSRFLANGGKSYFDTGKHPEIATGECGSARDCVIAYKSDERIFEDVARCLNAGIQHHGVGIVLEPEIREQLARLGGITFIKSNAGPDVNRMALHRVDATALYEQLASCPGSHYASWGSHINLLIEKCLLRDYGIARILGPFCFSSAWLTGSGMAWVTGGRRLEYSLSQRLPFVGDLHSSGATGLCKPMFKLKNDRPYADSEKYYRLQCVGLDSSVCEWQMFVPLVIMGIILRMAEDGAINPEEYWATGSRISSESVKMLEQTLLFGRERGVFPFRGEPHTAASLHEKYYLEPILRYKASGVSWSDEEEDGVQKYAFLLRMLQEATEQNWPSEKLAAMFAPYIGWATQLHHVILPDMRKHGYSFGCAANKSLQIVTRRKKSAPINAWMRVKIFNDAFLDVRRERSIYHTLIQNGLIERITREDEIEHGIEHPPSGTRAEARDKRLAELRELDGIVLTSVEWTGLGYRYVRGGITVEEYNGDPLSPDPRSFKILRT